jgi:hypothetical protein
MSQRLSTYTLRLLLYGVLTAPLVLFAVYAFSERWFFSSAGSAGVDRRPFYALAV